MCSFQSSYQWLWFLWWEAGGFHLEGLCSLTRQTAFSAAAGASSASSVSALSAPQQRMLTNTWGETTKHNASFLSLCLKKQRYNDDFKMSDKNEDKHDEWKWCVEEWRLKIAAYRRGFPISLLIVPHSTLVNFLVFRLGKDSLRHRQNSLSPSKRGLEKKIR